MAFLQQIIELLSRPPGSVIYHLLTLFALQVVLALAFSRWQRDANDEAARRMTFAAGGMPVSYTHLNPAEDPELGDYEAFRDCLTAVCVPLRVGFQLFGAMVIGTDTPVQFEDDPCLLYTSSPSALCWPCWAMT